MNRPECKGKIQPLDPSTSGSVIPSAVTAAVSFTKDSPSAVDEPVAAESLPPHLPAEPPETEEPGPPSAFELRADDQIGEDPEEMARQLNLEKAVEAVTGQNGANGHNGQIGSANLAPGEWSLEQPDQPHTSQAREVVSLPWFVRGMYDWARAQGWHVGDGTISAFVADCLIDHFTGCWGKAIVVVNRDEVQLVTK